MGRRLTAYAVFGLMTLGFYANGAWRGWWHVPTSGLVRALTSGGSGGGHGSGGVGGFRGGK